jgi:hypothetical protein
MGKLGGGKNTQQRRMEEAPKNGKKPLHCAHANECMKELMND